MKLRAGHQQRRGLENQDSLAHRNRSDFCDLRLRCPLRTPEIASDFREKFHCDVGVRWKVAGDLRFRVAISEPETPSFCGISGDLAPSTRKSLAIPTVRLGALSRTVSTCWVSLGGLSLNQAIGATICISSYSNSSSSSSSNSSTGLLNSNSSNSNSSNMLMCKVLCILS